MRGEADDPEEAAADYAGAWRGLRDDAGEPPRFDVVLLGLGIDGHTASLFPHSAALGETGRWVVAVHAAAAAIPRRLTMTLPVLNAARRVTFLSAGGEKAKVVRAVAQGVECQPRRRRSAPGGDGAAARGRAGVAPRSGSGSFARRPSRAMTPAREGRAPASATIARRPGRARQGPPTPRLWRRAWAAGTGVDPGVGRAAAVSTAANSMNVYQENSPPSRSAPETTFPPCRTLDRPGAGAGRDPGRLPAIRFQVGAHGGGEGRGARGDRDRPRGPALTSGRLDDGGVGQVVI